MSIVLPTIGPDFYPIFFIKIVCFPKGLGKDIIFTAVLVESGPIVGGKIDMDSQTSLNLIHVVSSIIEFAGVL